mgnify:CR=1 FL=1
MKLQAPTEMTPPAPPPDSFADPAVSSPSNFLPRHRRSPIVLKFMLTSLPLLILACLALLILGPRFYRLNSLKNLQDKAASLGLITTYSLAPAIIFNDPDNIKEILDSLSQISEIEYVLVFDTAGRELARYQRPLASPLASESDSPPSSSQTLNSQSSALPPPGELKKTAQTSDGLVWNTYSRIEHQGEPVGYLATGFSLKSMKAQVVRIRRIFILSSVLIFVFGLLTLYLLSRFVTRPLRHMTKTVQKIAAGNLDLRLDINTSDEVGQLASIFNYGLDELQKTMLHLEEARENLEKKVEERTAELQKQIEETEAVSRKLKESEELFRSMVESLGEAVIRVDPQEIFTFANPAARSIFNDADQKLEGHSLQEFTTPEDFDYVCRQTLRRQEGFRDTYDLELTFPDGSKKAVIVNAAPRFDSEGHFHETLAVLIDITERKKAEKDLSEAKNKLERANAELLQRNKSIVQLIEMSEAITLAKSEKEAIDLAISYAERLFPDNSGWLYLRPEREDFLELTAAWKETVPAEPFINLDECWALRRSTPHFVDGSNKAFLCPHLEKMSRQPGETACLPLNSAGETIGLLVTYYCPSVESAKASTFSPEPVDLTQFYDRRPLLVAFSQRVASSIANIRLRESLRQQSIRDPLTTLYNRRYLEETLEREFVRAKRLNQPVSIIMFDIDHFKKINDLYGHEAGDLALQAVARQLQKSVRAEDIVCRFGGEEFTAVMPGLPLDKALQRATVILEAVRNLELVFDVTLLQTLTMSAGVASFPFHGPTPADVLQAADRALFRAKKEGRDQALAADRPVK